MKRMQLKSGDVLNGLVFISDVQYEKHRRCKFKCKCGNIFDCLLRSVVSGNTKSCGCWGAESRSIRFKKHGLRQHDLYKIWCGIKTRCYNGNRADYKYYGGIGIKLSDEFHDFKAWFDYVISLPRFKERKRLKLTIDRIDPNNDYKRGNLRWATRKEQSLNQRRNSGF